MPAALSARPGIGIVGCGVIAAAYAGWMRDAYPDRLQALACYDVDPGRCAAFAQRFGLAPEPSLQALLARPDVELVLNLTNPQAHAEVTLAALAAGRHVYSEKPLALRLADADRIVEEAQRRGLRVAGAPSVMLGAPQRTTWRLAGEGRLGTVHEVFMNALTAGHELWHPSPRYYYQEGAGPLLDLGVYPLTVATTILGPIRRVWGQAGIAIPERSIHTGAGKGTRFPVEVPDRVTALVAFEGGATGTLHASFAVAGSTAPAFELHGTEASLWLEDWQNFGTKVRIRPRGGSGWEEVALPGPAAAPNWSRSVVDLTDAVREGRPARCSAEHARHVLEVMLGILASAERGGAPVDIERSFPAPQPLPD